MIYRLGDVAAPAIEIHEGEVKSRARHRFASLNRLTRRTSTQYTAALCVTARKVIVVPLIPSRNCLVSSRSYERTKHITHVSKADSTAKHRYRSKLTLGSIIVKTNFRGTANVSGHDQHLMSRLLREAPT
jgi:hypothetical protein